MTDNVGVLEQRRHPAAKRLMKGANMTKPEPPRRFKDYDELTVTEIAERQAALARGEFEPPMPETEEFKAYRNGVLERGGLPPDRNLDDVPPEQLTVREHVERMRRR
jgi:hypothetical protein